MAFALPEMTSLPELSLGTAVLVIFIACAAFAFVRGVLRLLLGVAVVAASIAAGIYTWNRVPELAAERFGTAPDWLPGSLAIAAGFLTFFVLRKILRFMHRPFEPNHRSARGALFSIIPALALIALVFTAVRHFGAGTEIRYFRDTVADRENASPLPLMVRLKDAAENLLPDFALRGTELYNDPARVNLAKLVTVMQDPAAVAKLQFRPEAVPLVTGERAASLRDPRIARLVEERRFNDLLRDPTLVSLLEEPEFRAQMETLDLDRILAVR